MEARACATSDRNRLAGPRRETGKVGGHERQHAWLHERDQDRQDRYRRADPVEGAGGGEEEGGHLDYWRRAGADRCASSSIASASSDHTRSGMSWPMPWASRNRAPGTAPATRRPFSTGTTTPSVPCTTRVGTRTSFSRSSRLPAAMMATSCRPTPNG